MRTAQLGLRCTLSAVLAFVFLATPVAAESEISIPFDDLIFGTPGSVILLAEVQVEAELVGLTCHLAVVAENQSSVHIGNDLIVSTGTSQAVVVGVEDTPNGGTNQTYEMMVGPTIMVQMRIGQDGMSSLGFGLSFDCDEPPPPPTPAQQQTDPPPETTTTIPVTTVAPTTVPTTVSPTTVATTVAPSTTTAPAQVAGAVTNAPLPEAPAAEAIAGAPAYTG